VLQTAMLLHKQLLRVLLMVVLIQMLN